MFERTYMVSAAPTLDVSTIRGQIDVSVGDTERIVVKGSATVRYGLSVPASAYELVKRVAANPPIQQEGATLRLRPPTGADEQRAMTPMRPRHVTPSWAISSSVRPSLK